MLPQANRMMIQGLGCDLFRMGYRACAASFDFGTYNSFAGSTDVEKLTRFVDWQLVMKTINNTECRFRIAAANMPTLTKSLTQLWNNQRKISNADHTQPAREGRDVTFIRAIYNRQQLFELLTNIWHNHSISMPETMPMPTPPGHIMTVTLFALMHWTIPV